MIIPAQFREVLSASIPSADFTPYFAFIESLSEADEGHRHHILPKKEFPEFAKESSNIIRVSPADHFVAHYYLALCTPQFVPFQIVFYLMAKCKTAQIGLDDLAHYARVYEKGQLAHVELCRANGQAHVESGHLAKLRTSEHQSKAGRAGGLVQGRKNSKSGQMANIGRTYGKIYGKIQGFISGRKAVESGLLRRVAAEGGRAGNHQRWHVHRGVVKLTCELCQKNSRGVK